MNNQLYCWGNNDQGELGDGTTVSSSSPVLVDSQHWDVVATGFEHTCGIRAGELFCWGNNQYGQLGDGTMIDQLTPTKVGNDGDWEAIILGAYHTCGIRSGELFCWGRNQSGSLGDGTLIDKEIPTRIGSDTDWITLGSGGYVSCGIRSNGQLYCWGMNDRLQIGNGDGLTDTSFPILVESACGDGIPGVDEACDDGNIVNGDGCERNCTLTPGPVSLLGPDDFESGFGNWTNLTSGDNFDWTRDSGGTTSTSTGPAVDHTLGTSSGYYLYTEASSNYGNTAILQSPCIDLSSVSQPTLTFFYHMWGSSMGALYVDVAYDAASNDCSNIGSFTTINTLSGQQQSSQSDPYLERPVDLSAYVGGSVILRIIGVTGSSYNSDMAIDDVQVTGIQ